MPVIELISLLAAVLGVTAKDATQLVQSRRQAWSKQKALRQRDLATRYGTPSAISAALLKYYTAERRRGTSLRQYGYTIDGSEHSSSMFTKAEWLCPSRRLATVAAHQVPDPQTSSSGAVPEHKKYATEVFARMEAQETELWEAPLFRLLRITPGAPRDLTFTTTSFMAYRFGPALVGDELIDQLIDGEGKLSDKLALPLRGRFLPSVSALESTDTRLCAGGLGTVLAMSEGGRFVIPLQIRSARVADGVGTKAVIPKAFHQPTVGSADESNPYWTVLRELYEECFGGKDFERDSPRLVFNSYLKTSPPVAYIHEHTGAAEVLYHGLALNSFNGNYELATSIVVLDEWFWRTLADVAHPNWESGRWTLLYTDDADEMKRTLLSAQLVNESRFHLAEALLDLRTRFPQMVADIGLQRVLS